MVLLTTAQSGLFGALTWRCVETRYIGRVHIYTWKPDLAYVAALGHAFESNQARGVILSQDGGGRYAC